MAGEMAAADVLAHAPTSFWPLVNGGEPAVLLCVVWLFFAAAGAGPLSVDALLARPRARETRTARISRAA